MDAARLELRLERDLRGVGARDHQQAAGVPVEPMDDARPLDAADRAQAAAVLRGQAQQRVHQGARGMARRRVRHQAGGLVHDEQVVVLVDDLAAGCPRAAAVAGTGSGTSSSTTAPGRQHVPGTDGTPSRVTRPSAMSRWTWAREMPEASATNRSARPAEPRRGYLDADHGAHGWPPLATWPSIRRGPRRRCRGPRRAGARTAR